MVAEFQERFHSVRKEDKEDKRVYEEGQRTFV